jgi:hypothetical protein
MIVIEIKNEFFQYFRFVVGSKTIGIQTTPKLLWSQQ